MTSTIAASITEALRRRAHYLIPGGAHTYSKGDDQYPELYPAMIARGAGSHVWDVDGNEYIEYGMGLRAVTLGHGYPVVAAAAAAAIREGTNFTRPSPLEGDCAELFLETTGAGDMVKFTKDGSTAVTAAIRLARAFTGRDYVAFCSDHPFFSYDDWFIGTTGMNAGIPGSANERSLKFGYNDCSSLSRLFREHPGEIACVIMEPEAGIEPELGYLESVATICRNEGALLVLDENITGFRWHLGGGQAFHGIKPDLSAWGKGLANGFALAALSGRRDVMELGGIAHEDARVFLLSTTHGAESHALAASIATMNTYREEPVVETLHNQGEKLKAGLSEVISDHGLDDQVKLSGRPWNLGVECFDPAGERSQAFRSLFLQENAKRGVIGPSFVLSYSHDEEDLDRTLEAVDGSLAVYGAALELGVERFLVGRPSKVVFRPFN